MFRGKFDIKREDGRSRQKTIVFLPYILKRRSFTTVYTPSALLILPYKVTEIYDRHTGPCNTGKYGRVRSVYGMHTVIIDRMRVP
jgi:hypothetical protein